MDWFRWHHGSVTDPKFRLVAKKAQASVAEVVAVWAFVLETASQNPERGAFGEIDTEALDLALGMDDGTTDRILSAMHDRALIADGRIPAWDKRQPKREDSTAAERQRLKRQREQELALAQAAAVTGDASRTVTQCHAASRAVTLEEKREEKKDQKRMSSDKPPTDIDARLTQVTDEAVEAYNAFAEPLGLAKALPVGMDKKRGYVRRSLKTIREICRVAYGAERIEPQFWADYFAAQAADDFIAGRTGRTKDHANWRPDFEYLTRPDVIAKAFERAAA